ncbi:FaeA/PapI family transcriptional regulator [Pseudomonas cerasi]
MHDFFEEKNSTSPSVVSASTRDVADRSELSIYNARHILIKLEREGVITSTRKENSKSLYWNKTEYFKV